MLATSPLASPTTESPARKKRKSRGRGLRTTTGCRTCRTRHMKCDEQKPICGPCERSGRDCAYKDGVETSTQHEVRESLFRHQNPRLHRIPLQKQRISDHLVLFSLLLCLQHVRQKVGVVAIVTPLSLAVQKCSTYNHQTPFMSNSSSISL
jgi:hypothetical protein